jgi:hypothetical protein
VARMIRLRTLMVTITCGAAMMLVGSGIGDAADSPAVSGQASSVTTTTAQLNGTVNPGGLDTFYAFQYGTSSSYGQDTSPVGPLTGTSGMSVSTLVRGLQPGTTYHFRLIAIQGQAGTSGESNGFTGNDETFTTSSSGSISATSTKGGKHAKASLLSRTLHVSHGATHVKWKCSGSAGASCKLKMSLTVRSGKHTVSCGSATFSAATGKHRSVRVGLKSRCVTLVNAALHHRLGATLKAVSSVGKLKVAVKLVG